MNSVQPYPSERTAVSESIPSTAFRWGHVVRLVEKTYSALSQVESAFFEGAAHAIVSLGKLPMLNKLSLRPCSDNDSMMDVFAKLHHLAIIPDGNRTWGRARGLTAAKSHQWVADSVIPRLISGFYDAGLHTFTIWLFSTENWNRGDEEVGNLMNMVEKRLADICLPICHRHKARLVHLGRKDRLPVGARQALERAVKETAHYSDHVFNVAIDYGGQDELERALEKISLKHGTPDGQTIAENLDTAGQPYPCPDFIIRTSGQQRLSGFMPWQSCYSEIYFENRPFPEMTWDIFGNILRQYATRQRRWGR